MPAGPTSDGSDSRGRTSPARFRGGDGRDSTGAEVSNPGDRYQAITHLDDVAGDPAILQAGQIAVLFLSETEHRELVLQPDLDAWVVDAQPRRSHHAKHREPGDEHALLQGLADGVRPVVPTDEFNDGVTTYASDRAVRYRLHKSGVARMLKLHQKQLLKVFRKHAKSSMSATGVHDDTM